MKSPKNSRKWGNVGLAVAQCWAVLSKCWSKKQYGLSVYPVESHGYKKCAFWTLQCLSCLSTEGWSWRNQDRKQYKKCKKVYSCWKQHLIHVVQAGRGNFLYTPQATSCHMKSRVTGISACFGESRNKLFVSNITATSSSLCLPRDIHARHKS